MPDADPKSDLKIRSVPRSVRLALHAQAVSRNLTYAQYIGWLLDQQAQARDIDIHPDEYTFAVLKPDPDGGLFVYKDGKFRRLPQEAVDLYNERNAIRDGTQ